MKAIPVFLAALLVVSGLAFGTPASAESQTATCKGSVGPGIPPPSQVPSGIPGFHAAWYGQSGYPTLCPGEKATSVVAYYNSGSWGWTQGRMGEAAYLGTWNWIPGQDKPSKLGGDGTNGSPNTGWPRYNRIAQQPSVWVGPGQVAWFQFTIQAPTTPGVYKLYLRPLVEGSTWMEDYGVFWVVTVLNPDGTQPPPPPPDPPVGCSEWPMELGNMFAKLPLPSGICLVTTPPSDLPANCVDKGGCWLPKSNTVWVNDSPLMASTAVSTTAHEVCHAHQTFYGSQLRALWADTPEGREFARAFDDFKESYPGVYYEEFEKQLVTTHFEAFAEICSMWYFARPLSWAPSIDITQYPSLYGFTLKWLPR